MYIYILYIYTDNWITCTNGVLSFSSAQLIHGEIPSWFGLMDTGQNGSSALCSCFWHLSKLLPFEASPVSNIPRTKKHFALQEYFFLAPQKRLVEKEVNAAHQILGKNGRVGTKFGKGWCWIPSTPSAWTEKCRAFRLDICCLLVYLLTCFVLFVPLENINSKLQTNKT